MAHSIAIGQPAPSDPSPTPATAPAGSKPSDPTNADVGDLERLLHQENSIAPVSRVMGYRIVESAVKPYIHGTLVGDWRWHDGDPPLPNTFELREAHLYAGAHILNVAQPEVFLQFEQNANTDPPVSLRYAQVDLNAYKELLVFRVGMFLIPFGVYNTDLFLRYIAKLPERPEIHGRLLPAAWKEVGVQARGRWEFGHGRALSYAFYVTNGLLLSTTTSNASSVPTITFQPALRDPAGGKSVGGRVAIEPFEELSIGLSGYNGAIGGVTGQYQLVGLDAIYRHGRFSLDGEVLTGRESASGQQPVTKQGFYVAAGYKITDWFEPVASIERTNASEAYQAQDYWAGFNIYPFPESFPTIVFKGAYGRQVRFNGVFSNRVTLQLVVGY